MDESAIKGMELLELTDRDADTRKNRIVVEGYDTSLPVRDVEAALRQHFASCGKLKLIHVFVPLDVTTGLLNRFGLIFVRGDEEENALRLDGSDMGGRTVKTKAYSFYEIDPQLAPLRESYINARQQTIKVTGFDTSLPKDDVMNALKKHFSSLRAFVSDDRSGRGGLSSEGFVTAWGEDAIEKALDLSGRAVGGLNIVVTEVLPLPKLMKCGYTLKRTRDLVAADPQKYQGIYFL